MSLQPTLYIYIDNLREVTSVAETLFTITGARSTTLDWAQYGLYMTIQEGSIPAGKSCDVAVMTLVGGQFKFPDGSILVSAVYVVSLTRKLLKPALIAVQHCVDVQNEEHSRSLQFVVASCTQKMLPYEFTPIPDWRFYRRFYPGIQYATLHRQTFSMIATVYNPQPPLHGNSHVYMYILIKVHFIVLQGSSDSARYPDMLCIAQTIYHRNGNRWSMEFVVAHHLNALERVR